MLSEVWAKCAAACERVNVCMWVRDWGREAEPEHGVGVCKQPCVQHIASGCESLRERRLILRVAPAMLSCSSPRLQRALGAL